MVGSEGTLAFVASVVMRTVPLLKHAMTGLLVFDSLSGATGSLPALVATGAGDHRTAGRGVAAGRAGGPGRPTRACGGSRSTGTRRCWWSTRPIPPPRWPISARPLIRCCRRCRSTGPAALTADPRARARLWHTRKGLYATVAGARPSGTTALLEDIVVPVPALLETCEQLTGLFAKHGYRTA